ncbi:hypothetical protein HDU98_008674 [Podochytrium sp. JEL0797]|nr:hypothetical protein HDU98_008674 [Podochytrium sp. JEL0797]
MDLPSPQDQPPVDPPLPAPKPPPIPLPIGALKDWLVSNSNHFTAYRPVSNTRAYFNFAVVPDFNNKFPEIVKAADEFMKQSHTPMECSAFISEQIPAFTDEAYEILELTKELLDQALQQFPDLSIISLIGILQCAKGDDYGISRGNKTGSTLSCSQDSVLKSTGIASVDLSMVRGALVNERAREEFREKIQGKQGIVLNFCLEKCPVCPSKLEGKVIGSNYGCGGNSCQLRYPCQVDDRDSNPTYEANVEALNSLTLRVKLFAIQCFSTVASVQAFGNSAAKGLGLLPFFQLDNTFGNPTRSEILNLFGKNTLVYRRPHPSHMFHEVGGFFPRGNFAEGQTVPLLSGKHAKFLHLATTFLINSPLLQQLCLIEPSVGPNMGPTKAAEFFKLDPCGSFWMSGATSYGEVYYNSFSIADAKKYMAKKPALLPSDYFDPGDFEPAAPVAPAVRKSKTTGEELPPCPCGAPDHYKRFKSANCLFHKHPTREGVFDHPEYAFVRERMDADTNHVWRLVADHLLHVAKFKSRLNEPNFLEDVAELNRRIRDRKAAELVTKKDKSIPQPAKKDVVKHDNIPVDLVSVFPKDGWFHSLLKNIIPKLDMIRMITAVFIRVYWVSKYRSLVDADESLKELPLPNRVLYENGLIVVASDGKRGSEFLKTAWKEYKVVVEGCGSLPDTIDTVTWANSLAEMATEMSTAAQNMGTTTILCIIKRFFAAETTTYLMSVDAKYSPSEIWKLAAYIAAFFRYNYKAECSKALNAGKEAPPRVVPWNRITSISLDKVQEHVEHQHAEGLVAHLLTVCTRVEAFMVVKGSKGSLLPICPHNFAEHEHLYLISRARLLDACEKLNVTVERTRPSKSLLEPPIWMVDEKIKEIVPGTISLKKKKILRKEWYRVFRILLADLQGSQLKPHGRAKYRPCGPVKRDQPGILESLNSGIAEMVAKVAEQTLMPNEIVTPRGMTKISAALPGCSMKPKALKIGTRVATRLLHSFAPPAVRSRVSTALGFKDYIPAVSILIKAAEDQKVKFWTAAFPRIVKYLPNADTKTLSGTFTVIGACVFIGILKSVPAPTPGMKKVPLTPQTVDMTEKFAVAIDMGMIDIVSAIAQGFKGGEVGVFDNMAPKPGFWKAKNERRREKAKSGDISTPTPPTPEELQAHLQCKRQKKSNYRKRRKKRSRKGAKDIKHSGGLWNIDVNNPPSAGYAFTLSIDEWRDRKGTTQAAIRRDEAKAAAKAVGNDIDKLQNQICTAKTLQIQGIQEYARSFHEVVDKLHAHEASLVKLRWIVYQQTKKAEAYVVSMLHGSLPKDKVVLIIGSAQFGSVLPGTNANSAKYIVRLLQQYFPHIVFVYEYKTTISCSGCFGVCKCDEIDLNPHDGDVNIEGIDCMEDLKKQFEGGRMNLQLVEKVLRAHGADVSGLDVKELLQVPVKEGEELEDGGFDDDEFDGDFDDAFDEELVGGGDVDAMELDVDMDVEAGGEDTESDDLESDDNGQPLLGAKRPPSKPLPEPDPPEVKRAKTDPNPRWFDYARWSGNSDVFPEEAPHSALDTVKSALLAKIRKSKKPWRMGWHTDETLEKRLEHAYKRRGVPGGTPLRGVKWCPDCGTMWDRDKNAARNILYLFWHLRLNDMKRPFSMQPHKKE